MLTTGYLIGLFVFGNRAICIWLCNISFNMAIKHIGKG
jgi:hypothetical protein